MINIIILPNLQSLMEKNSIIGKIESKVSFIYCDVDLWGMVINGYTHPTDANGTKLEIIIMNEQQKKDHKNHHISKTILLNVIYYLEYENITNRDYGKSVIDYLKMTHEGNE